MAAEEESVLSYLCNQLKADLRLQYRYEPPEPEPLLLNTLPTNVGSVDRCPHFLFKSPNELVDYILWMLYPSSNPVCAELHISEFTSTRHDAVRRFCTLCITRIISKVSMVNLMRSYSVCARYPASTRALPQSYCKLQAKLNSLLLRSLFRHPQMHKIFIQSCPMNRNMYKMGVKTLRSEPVHSQPYANEFHFMMSLMVDELITVFETVLLFLKLVCCTGR